MKSSLLIPSGTLLIACLAQHVQADETAVRTLPKVQVEATDTVIVRGSYTAESTRTATGLNLSLRETPQSVSVITRERIEDQAMTTVGDALRNTTGVSLKPVDRGRNNLSVRGFEVNNFQLDGAPITTGNIGLETISTAIYERIEVVRGATGLLSGAGDPSAAVNLVRRHATSDSFAGTFSAELGSWNQRTATLDVSAPLNSAGTVRGRFIANHGRQDAFIDLEHTRRTVLYGVVDADLGARARLSVGASEQVDKRSGVLWASLPYWYSDGSRTDWSRDKTSATDWNRWDTRDRTAFATLTYALPKQWSVRADVTYHQQDEDSMLLWMWGDPDRDTGLGMEAYPYHYFADPQQLDVSVTASGPFRLFGREHELMAGVIRSRLEDGWLNQDAVSAVVDPVGDFNQWDGSYAEPEMTEFYVGSEGTTTQTAAYLATRLQLSDRLIFIGGMRVTDWERDDEGGAWGAPYLQKESSVFTPYAGVVVDLAQRLSAYANYTDSFKPQTSRDRDGRYLDPLTGRSYEVGIKSELFDGRLFASAALFRVDQENFAVTDVGHTVPGTLDPAMRATQGVKSKGYELEATGELARGLQLSLGWTHYSAKDADDVDVAVDHARELLRLFAKYQLPGTLSGLSFGGGLNWEGDRPATATNPATGEEEKVGQPAFALVDLMSRYELNERVTLQLNVSNVLDKKYRSSSFWWGAPYNYGEPRKIVLSMDYGF
jgi:outer membrane receptor for ferric coprogen and ferric-rhodotorulic acid